MPFPLLRKGRLVGLLVIAFWVLMMALLWRRQGAVQGAAEESPSSRTADSWLGLSVDGRRAGYLHLREEPASRQGETGVRSELGADLTLELLGQPTRMQIDGVLWRSSQAPRIELDFRVRSGGQELRIEGTVAEGSLVARLHSGGEVIPVRFSVDPELLRQGFATLRLPPLAPGEETSLESFDPFTLSPGRLTVRALRDEDLTVAGETRPARVLELESSAGTATAWVAAEDGEVLRLSTPFGLEFVRISPREALEEGTDEGAGEALLERTAVRPSGERPHRGARRLRLRLRGAPGTLPQSPAQRRRADGSYLLESVPPPTAHDRAGETEPRYLAAEPLVQSDHPRIREQAAAIVGAEQDPWQRAVRLERWLYERLDKEPVLSVPSALEVLDDRRGDCNEHTVLFVALARAAGIPARTAIGVVWSDEGEGFFYHAWPEVFVGRWVAVDPTLGQEIADATHLELIRGGIEQWPRLVTFLGQLEIEVLEVE